MRETSASDEKVHNEQHDQESKEADRVKPRLLVHACCGPCVTAVEEHLREAYDPVFYWYNPNIQPQQEYDKRLTSLRLFAERQNMVLVEDDGGEEEFAAAAVGHEEDPEGGERCIACYEMRLRKAIEYAAAHGFSYVTTALTISPHKSAETINAIGRRLADAAGIEFIGRDFAKDGGFKRSVELSRLHGLYRQSYCGCLYGLRMLEKKRQELKKS